MRRALLLAAAALASPLARAQTTTTKPAAITFTEGTNDLVHGPWISVDECKASKAAADVTTTAPRFVDVSWNMTSFPMGGEYQLYATNADPTGKATCPTSDSTSPDYKAGTIGSPITGETGSVVDVPVYFVDMFSAIKLADCEGIGGDTPIWICAQARDSAHNPVSGAIAVGRIILSIARPAKPLSVSASPADTGALEISWTAPGGSPSAYDYRISASSADMCGTAKCDPNTHDVTDLRTLGYVLNGLTTGVTYTVDVWARSEAGNESTNPAETTAKAVKVANFWDVCHDAPYSCPEQGGCGVSQPGAAGAASLALLAVAALVAKLRRRA